MSSPVAVQLRHRGRGHWSSGSRCIRTATHNTGQCNTRYQSVQHTQPFTATHDPSHCNTHYHSLQHTQPVTATHNQPLQHTTSHCNTHTHARTHPHNQSHTPTHTHAHTRAHPHTQCCYTFAILVHLLVQSKLAWVVGDLVLGEQGADHLLRRRLTETTHPLYLRKSSLV